MSKLDISWPQGKSFAFTIFDDTDSSTLENTRGVYSFLFDNGFLTTKSVWVLDGESDGFYKGSTCQDENYFTWIKELQNSGFEIGYHMAACDSSKRRKTISALELFKDYFGYYPKTMANHSRCAENIYWGNYRLSGLNKVVLYNILTRRKNIGKFRGHIERDEYYWGDHCKEKIKYIRNFVFNDINTLKKCPFMPYHDENKPFVNYWFSSSDGHDVNKFNKLISEKNQDNLVESGGACIVYTHFADGFIENGVLNNTFKFLIKTLSEKGGWFIPVYELLDYLNMKNNNHVITYKQRFALEYSWLKDQILSKIN